MAYLFWSHHVVSINQGSLAVAIISPRPSYVRESEKNVKLEEQRSHSAVRKTVVVQISSALYVSLSHRLFVAVWSARNQFFFFFLLPCSNAQRNDIYTSIRGPRCCKCILIGLMIEKVGRVKSGLPFFSFLWHFDKTKSIYWWKICLIVHTKLIDGTLPVIHQSVSPKQILCIRFVLKQNNVKNSNTCLERGNFYL